MVAGWERPLELIMARLAVRVAAHLGAERQYSVTGVDLRRPKPADVLKPHPLSLLPRALGITEGAREDYVGYMTGQYEDHARLRADATAATDRIHRLSGSRAAVAGEPCTKLCGHGDDQFIVV